eukprot:5586966-Amphidinium_carterae.1
MNGSFNPDASRAQYVSAAVKASSASGGPDTVRKGASVGPERDLDDEASAPCAEPDVGGDASTHSEDSDVSSSSDEVMEAVALASS